MDNLIIGEELNIAVNHEDAKALIGYQCNDCKCGFLSLNENLEKCVYCDSTNIVQATFNLDNCKMIPFSKKLDDAWKEYKKHTIFNPLIPVKFKSKKIMNSIKKVYFLAYKIDASLTGNVSFTSNDQEKVKKNETRQEYEVLFDINFDYTNALINASKKITSKEFIKAFPTDFSSMCDLLLTFINEEAIIVSDYTNEEFSKIVKEKISKNSFNIVHKNINHKKSTIKDDLTNLKVEYFQPILIPIYFLNLKYRNKEYHYLYNGVNEKVYYKFPIGIVETIIFGILIFGLTLLIGYLIAKAL